MVNYSLSSPLAPQRVRFAPQNRLLESAECKEKNGELKKAHGLHRAESRGLFAMRLQMYFTAFTANVKRIVKMQEIAM